MERLHVGNYVGRKTMDSQHFSGRILALNQTVSKPRALIVDDDEPIRSLLATIVEHQGFDVETARDGNEAIEMLDDDGYNVVVLDLMMPRVDGYAVLRHMHDTQPGMIGRTIVATAVPEREVARSLHSPVFKVHAKPFDVGQLMDDVRKCVDEAA
jgi:DNA-binding NtrC family response regulator